MTRPRRGGWRWWGKWTAAVITVLLAAVWFASGWWIVAWVWDPANGTTALNVWAGSLKVSAGPRTPKFPRGQFEGMMGLRDPRSWQVSQDYGPWPGTIELTRLSELAPEWPRPFWYFRPTWTSVPRLTEVSIPLWIPGSAVVLTGLILFHLDRRRPSNCCPHCRYDLSATPPSAPCPECGEGGRAQQSPNAEAAEPAARTTP
jgi:hypothetical protein